MAGGEARRVADTRRITVVVNDALDAAAALDIADYMIIVSTEVEDYFRTMAE